MAKLPKIKDVKVSINIQEEPLDAKMIPISVKAQANIESAVEDLKLTLKTKNKQRIQDFKDRIESEGHTDEELKDTYLTGKITWKLAESGKDNTPEEMEAQKKKFGKKLLGTLTPDQLSNEIAKLSIDMMERKELLNCTVSNTLYEILRNPENLRKHLFEDNDELIDLVSEEDMYEMFKQFGKAQDVKDDEVKN
jgi:hypothetical protein